MEQRLAGHCREFGTATCVAISERPRRPMVAFEARFIVGRAIPAH